jgi:starch synthase
MKVLHVASEVAPYSKTGGLADVAAGLPAALSDLGIQVKVVSPLYGCVREAVPKLGQMKRRLRISSRHGELDARLFHHRIQLGLTFHFVERDEFYDRSRLYGTSAGDYFDNADRFIFLDHAALRACRALRFRPDIIHCHDWQTGLIPALVKSAQRQDPYWRKARTVFTIHNLAYQGVFPPEYMTISGLPPELFHLQGLEFYGRMNFLKAGIVGSDRITTVSPRYAREILTPEFGHGLDGALRQHRDRLAGILNGVDYADWNPASDPHIECRYTPRDLSGKSACKSDLLSRFGLGGRPEFPLIGMVTRLAEQKGLDLLVEAASDIMRIGVRMVILGRGDDRYENAVKSLARRFPERIAVRLDFDPVLAHKIEAGADLFLMPSRFEPCGLNQMYSLKYGTIPIVHAVGGLDDTIKDFDPQTGKGNGFKFGKYSAPALVREVRRAAGLFRRRDQWERLIKNAMRADFSWAKAARRYLRLYEHALSSPPAALPVSRH